MQVDYNLPERFDLSYVGADNKTHHPVMIHRAPFGSLERFCGVLIEHFAGDFPTWLAPEQVRILPLNDTLNMHADELAATFRMHKVRVSVDAHNDKLGAKIRRAELDKVPHILVIGSKEKEAGVVSIRSRANKAIDGTQVPAEAFLETLLAEIRERRLAAK